MTVERFANRKVEARTPHAEFGREVHLSRDTFLQSRDQAQTVAPRYVGDKTKGRMARHFNFFSGRLDILMLVWKGFRLLLDLIAIGVLLFSVATLVLSLFGVALPFALTTGVLGFMAGAAAVTCLILFLLEGPILRHIKTLARLARIIRS